MTARYLPFVASRLAELAHLPSDATIVCARMDTGIATLTASAAMRPDMITALRTWQRMLRPSGSVAFSCFGAHAFQPLAGLYEARIRSYGVKPAGPARYFLGLQLNDPESCRDLLHEAGFESIEVRVEQLGYHLQSADEWWDIAWNSSIRDLVASLSPSQLAQFKSGHLDEVSTLATARGIWLDVPAIFAVGRIPAFLSGEGPE
jgi:hypothetical protein